MQQPPKHARWVWRNKIWCALLLAATWSLPSCGGASNPNGRPPAPSPTDPWFGTVGNALIGEATPDHDGTQDFLWVGFDSTSAWQDVLDVRQKGGWVIGQVVIAPGTKLGFYFDPQTTDGAEVTIEACQTSMDSIKAKPAAFTQGPITRWCIPAVIVTTR